MSPVHPFVASGPVGPPCSAWRLPPLFIETINELDKCHIRNLGMAMNPNDINTAPLTLDAACVTLLTLHVNARYPQMAISRCHTHSRWGSLAAYSCPWAFVHATPEGQSLILPPNIRRVVVRSSWGLPQTMANFFWLQAPGTKSISQSPVEA